MPPRKSSTVCPTASKIDQIIPSKKMDLRRQKIDNTRREGQQQSRARARPPHHGFARSTGAYAEPVILSSKGIHAVLHDASTQLSTRSSVIPISACACAATECRAVRHHFTGFCVSALRRSDGGSRDGLGRVYLREERPGAVVDGGAQRPIIQRLGHPRAARRGSESPCSTGSLSASDRKQARKGGDRDPGKAECSGTRR